MKEQRKLLLDPPHAYILVGAVGMGIIHVLIIYRKYMYLINNRGKKIHCSSPLTTCSYELSKEEKRLKTNNEKANDCPLKLILVVRQRRAGILQQPLQNPWIQAAFLPRLFSPGRRHRSGRAALVQELLISASVVVQIALLWQKK